MEYDDEDAGVLDNVGQLFMVMSEKYRADGRCRKGVGNIIRKRSTR